MNPDTKRKVVYRIKLKGSTSWSVATDSEGRPITIETDRPQTTVPYIFRTRYASLASMYNIDDIVAEPDWEATKTLEEFRKQRQIDDDERIQDMWWNK